MRDRIMGIFLSLPFLDEMVFGYLKMRKSRSFQDFNIEFPNDIRSSHDSNQRKWVIRTSVPRNDQYKNWGDYYFAQEIISSLAKYGERAYIAFRGDEVTPRINDINFVLRGLFPYRINRHAKNIIWVISHPNQVSIRELRKFDHVFAASESWSKKKSKKIEKKITFLPQATNAKKNNLESQLKREGIIFVGNSLNRRRQIVQDVIKLGFKVKIIGKGWNGKVPKDMIAGENVSYYELLNAYRSACIVLNDHWRDMKSNGFVSNRVFDSIASGAFVISDNVNTGLHFPNFYQYDNLKDLEEKLTYQLNLCKTSESTGYEEVKKFLDLNTFDQRIKSILKSIN